MRKILFAGLVLLLSFTACKKDNLVDMVVEVSCVPAGFVVEYTYGEQRVEKTIHDDVFVGGAFVPEGTQVTALAQSLSTEAHIVMIIYKDGKPVARSEDSGDYCIASCKVEM